MVTGDASSTALAIANQVGIVRDTNDVRSFRQQDFGNSEDVEAKQERDQKRAIVIQGSAIENATREEWDFIFSHEELVFARTTPEQKLSIVVESQRRKNITAVTGDGVNDSPALKSKFFIS